MHAESDDGQPPVLLSIYRKRGHSSFFASVDSDLGGTFSIFHFKKKKSHSAQTCLESSNK